jgi:replication initiation and membrane attachment protein DnaB
MAKLPRWLRKEEEEEEEEEEEARVERRASPSS